MDAPAEPRNDKATQRTQEVRGPEIGPALKRDQLLARVRAARKRLQAPPGSLARLR
jgi:hypothetical protein